MAVTTKGKGRSAKAVKGRVAGAKSKLKGAGRAKARSRKATR